MDTQLLQDLDTSADPCLAGICQADTGVQQERAGLEDNFPWHRIRRLSKKG